MFCIFFVIPIHRLYHISANNSSDFGIERLHCCRAGAVAVAAEFNRRTIDGSRECIGQLAVYHVEKRIVRGGHILCSEPILWIPTELLSAGGL